MSPTTQKECRHIVLPRTLTKAAIKAALKIRNTKQFRKVITPQIIEKMGLDKKEHGRIREYNIHQTKILIKELQLTDEDLIEISKYM